MRALVLVLFVELGAGLLPALGRVHTPRKALRLCCMASEGSSAGKGFGTSKKASKGAPKKTVAAVPLEVAEFSADAMETADDMEARGRAALEQLRKQSGSAPKKVQSKKDMLTPAELEPLDPSAGVMPEVVSNRMLGRVIPFAALPIFLGALVFFGFYYANTQLELDLPPQIVATITQGLLLLSFAGITWGVMSTSLDEEVEGSFLGTEQVKKNFDIFRGVEDERIASTKAEIDMEEAADAGVMMSRAALEKAERKKKRKAKGK